MSVHSAYKYSRSKRSQAFKVLFASVATVVSSYFAIKLLGDINGGQLMFIYGVIASLFIAIFLFLVLPNLLSEGGLLFSIDDSYVTCTLPDGDTYSINISDIDHILKSRMSAQNNYVDYWIVCQSGESYLIPAIFGLAPESVLKSLKQIAPNINIKNTSSY